MKLTKLNSNNPLITKATINVGGIDYPVQYRENIGNIFEVRINYVDGYPRFFIGTLKDGKIINWIPSPLGWKANEAMMEMVVACPKHVKAMFESGGKTFTQRGRLYCTYGNKNWDELHAKNVAAGIIA